VPFLQVDAIQGLTIVTASLQLDVNQMFLAAPSLPIVSLTPGPTLPITAASMVAVAFCLHAPRDFRAIHSYLWIAIVLCLMAARLTRIPKLTTVATAGLSARASMPIGIARQLSALLRLVKGIWAIATGLIRTAVRLIFSPPLRTAVLAATIALRKIGPTFLQMAMVAFKVVAISC